MNNARSYQVITIFPDIINDYAKQSILGRAQKTGLVRIKVVDLRKFTTDKHHKVDDTPYGGGPGMVLKPEPIFKAVEKVKKDLTAAGPATATVSADKTEAAQVILMDPRGEPFTQKIARELVTQPKLIFIAGRYEGIDERVRTHLVDRTISVGPYILSGGELPALTIIEATARLIPGVLGKQASLDQESFDDSLSGALEYPQYTKPEDFRGYRVPKILLSGDHEAIEAWRRKKTAAKPRAAKTRSGNDTGTYKR